MSTDAPHRTIEAILDLARWAPSGDNTQPWRFEIVDHAHVVVHAFDTRGHCVYDLDGSASQIAVGALVETFAIAATRFGMRASATRRPDSPEHEPLLDLRIAPAAGLAPDPLVDAIEVRSVQRRALETTPLTAAEKDAMVAAVGPRHSMVWREDARARARMAGFLFRSARLRLVMPEAYLVHREAIEWGARFSEDRVPEAAVGVDPGTAKLMRWVMGSWSRVAFFNRFLAGTWAPRIQLDVIPARRCAAHFFLVRHAPPAGIDDFIDSGRAMQRLWLTATHLGLQMQPEMTPLIFARYGREGRRFSRTARLHDDALDLASRFSAEIGEAASRAAVFMGRIGRGKAAASRSLRLPLAALRYDAARWTETQPGNRSGMRPGVP